MSLASSHGVALVVGGDDAEHGPEDLFLGDRGAVVDVAEHRRLDEPAPVEVRGPAAAGRQRGALLDALGDVAEDPVALALGDERAHLGLLGERITDGDLRHGRGERVDQLVVPRPGHDDAGQRRAHLAGEEALGAGEGGRRDPEVHVVEHDGRRLPAELERAAGDPLAADGRDPTPGRGGAR